jgi:hypothetical protein
VTIFADDGMLQAARMMPPGQCPDQIVPKHYTPILAIPKAAASIASEYAICDPAKFNGATFVPITTTSLAMPQKTKWGVKVPPLPRSSEIETQAILRYMTAEVEEMSMEVIPTAMSAMVESAEILD